MCDLTLGGTSSFVSCGAVDYLESVFSARIRSAVEQIAQEIWSDDSKNTQRQVEQPRGSKRWCGACCVNSNTSHTACADAHTLSAYHIAPIPCSTSVAQGQPDCVPRIVVSFYLSRAMSLPPPRAPSSLSSNFSSVPGLQRLLTSRNPCAGPRERVTVYEPTASSTTRSLLLLLMFVLLLQLFVFILAAVVAAFAAVSVAFAAF